MKTAVTLDRRGKTMKVEEVFFDPEPKRVVAHITIPDGEFIYSIPQVAQKLFELLPGFRNHKCFDDDDVSVPWPKVALTTERPHLLEHLVIELQSRVNPFHCRGLTEWGVSIPKGVFRVSMDYQWPKDALILVIVSSWQWKQRMMI